MKNNIYKTKTFYRWQRKNFISDKKLRQAVLEIKQGLIDADLGVGLIKKCIANSGFGKSSGYRVLIATNQKDKWFFIFGFAKNENDNIDYNQLSILKLVSKSLLEMSYLDIAIMLDANELLEIEYA